VSFSAQERTRILEHSPLGPPPPDPSNAVADNPAAARLGQALFFDARLSSGNISCATCHVPVHGFIDGKPVSEGVGKGERRTPPLWNAAYGRWFFWDGRKDSLWSQSLSPIENPVEMGGSRLAAAHLIASDPALRAQYEALFGALPPLEDAARFPASGHPFPDAAARLPAAGNAGLGAPGAAWDGMTQEDRRAVDVVYARIGKSIEAYERLLVSRSSPFDRFAEDLRAGRESAALSPPALRGLKLFVGRANCRVCHSGPNFTDGEFHNTGITQASASRNQPPSSAAPIDSGRFAGVDALLADPFNRLGPYGDAPGAPKEQVRNLRKSPEMWGQFKTPSLRNVSQRAPFMHAGQLATLRAVVEFYSLRKGAPPPGPGQENILVPLNLSAAEIDDLLAFLDALTDTSLPDALLLPPPNSGDPQSD
jgi:cytochrome c peroxidase